MSEQWKQRSRPVRLERRYEFQDYEMLRDFLDRAAEVSEREGLYPDMGFGRNYVNMTIHAAEGDVEPGQLHHSLAQQLDALLSKQTTH